MAAKQLGQRKDPSQRTFGWTFQVGLAVFFLTFGAFLVDAGTYGALEEIIDSYKGSGARHPGHALITQTQPERVYQRRRDGLSCSHR